MTRNDRSGYKAVQQSAFVALALTSLIASAEAKIVIADNSSRAASPSDPPFKPDPPLRIQQGASPHIGYVLYGAGLYGAGLYGAGPSWFGGGPLVTSDALRTAAITRSIRNDAIRLRLARQAMQHRGHH